VVALAAVAPSEEAVRIAAEHDKDPRHVEVVLRESVRIVRRGHGVLICETRHGFVCANAGVDLSNAPGPEHAVLLPLDPDASARALRERLLARGAGPLAVIVSDTFGRPWREGLVDVALGCAGLDPIDDQRGQPDLAGRILEVTATATADQLAAAAGLLMPKRSGVPAVWIRGLSLAATARCGERCGIRRTICSGENGRAPASATRARRSPSTARARRPRSARRSRRPAPPGAPSARAARGRAAPAASGAACPTW
jgi:coenzyme F420-0:L-glutamate ligase/coenzyme F420-1:gamma-L-glutamate ligase